MDSRDFVDAQATTESINVTPSTVVFYPLRRGVLVTDGWFCAEHQRLAVRDIGDVGWRQSGNHVTRRVARDIVLTETALVAVVCVMAAAWDGLTVAVLGLGAVYLIGAAFVTWWRGYRYPGRLQLWVYRSGGRQMLVFSSADQTEFHKVRRALERAVEYHQELAF